MPYYFKVSNTDWIRCPSCTTVAGAEIVAVRYLRNVKPYHHNVAFWILDGYSEGCMGVQSGRVYERIWENLRRKR